MPQSKKKNPQKASLSLSKENFFGSQNKSIRGAILNPKSAGYTGNDKPLVLILHSPHDNSKDTAVKFDSVRGLVEDRGYSVLNKKRINFPKDDSLFNLEEVKKNIKMQLINPKKPITIWLECHGDPGSLFGDPKINTNEDELKATFTFVKGLEYLQEELNVKMNKVILNACFSGIELANAELVEFLNSPARLVSQCKQDTLVIGFLGINSSAKISNIWEPTTQFTFTPAVLSLEDGSVLFKNGEILEYNAAQKIYGNLRYFSESLKEEFNLTEGDFFQITPGKECLEKEISPENLQKCRGMAQLKACDEYKESKKEWDITVARRA